MRPSSKGENKPVSRLLLFLLLVLCGVAALGVSAANAGLHTARAVRETKPIQSQAPVYLYFGEPEGRFLTGEPTAIKNSGDPLAYARRIVEALIGGPTGSLIPTLPETARLRSIFIDGQIAYVDFSKEIAEAHPGGVRSELLTVYSIVNTLILNMEEIDRVKILIEGHEAETLAGHIDIAYPLNAQMLLVR